MTASTTPCPELDGRENARLDTREMSLWTFAKITLTLKHPAAMASVSLPPRRVGESFHIPAGKGILDLMIEAPQRSAARLQRHSGSPRLHLTETRKAAGKRQGEIDGQIPREC
jgi:hypothetical protein